MGAIFKREFRAYFKSPIGYIFLGFFVLLASLIFVMMTLSFKTTTLSYFFDYIGIVFIPLIPILTMRMFSEERKTKTDQLLLTAPVKVSEIVFGKFFAAVCVLLIACAGVSFYISILKLYGSPAVSENIIGYFGLFLMGMLFVSFGMYMSSLTESQVIAAISTLAVLIVVWLVAIFPVDFTGLFKGSLTGTEKFMNRAVNFIAATKRFDDFKRGIFNVVPVFYYISLTALFNVLTIRNIDKRRWR
jgi:ABC-2 type transport system permease protein